MSFHLFFIILFFLKVIVGSSPLYVHYEKEHHLLLWKDEVKSGSHLQHALLQHQYQWDSIGNVDIIWPIWRLSEKKYFTEQAWRPPLSSNEGRFHLLGTYELGRDVFVSLLFGLQKSLLISIFSVLMALLLGLPIGVAFSYLGFEKLKLNFYHFIGLLILCLFIFYLVILSIEIRYFGIMFVISLGLLIYFASCISFKTAKNYITINPDFLLMRWIELVKSIPLLLILLILLQIVNKPDFFTLSLLIGVLLSVSIAKYSRFITMSDSKENFIMNLKALGYSPLRIILQHLIPKVFHSIQPIIYLSLGSVILVEASISFLGLGLPIEEISLGGMMHTARSYPNAWWIILFPGLAIYWLVYCFQKLHQEEFTDRLSY